MDKRIKKNHKNELLEDIRKIVKEEMEKTSAKAIPTYIPYPVPSVEPVPWQPPQPYYHPYWDRNTTSYSLQVTGHCSF